MMITFLSQLIWMLSMSLSFRRMLCSSNARRGPNLTILTMMKIKKLLMMGQTLMKMTKKRKLGITKVRHKKKKEDRDNTEENMKQLLLPMRQECSVVQARRCRTAREKRGEYQHFSGLAPLQSWLYLKTSI